MFFIFFKLEQNLEELSISCFQQVFFDTWLVNVLGTFYPVSKKCKLLQWLLKTFYRETDNKSLQANKRCSLLQNILWSSLWSKTFTGSVSSLATPVQKSETLQCLNTPLFECIIHATGSNIGTLRSVDWSQMWEGERERVRRLGAGHSSILAADDGMPIFELPVQYQHSNVF